MQKTDVHVCIWLLALSCLLAVKVQVISCSEHEYHSQDTEEGISGKLFIFNFLGFPTENFFYGHIHTNLLFS